MQQSSQSRTSMQKNSQTAISGESNNGEIHKIPVSAQEAQGQKANNVSMVMSNNSIGQNDQQQHIVHAAQPSAQNTNSLPVDNQTVLFAPWKLSGTLPNTWTGGSGVPISQIPRPNLIQSDTTPQNPTLPKNCLYVDTTNSEKFYPLSNILPLNISSVLTQKEDSQSKNQVINKQGRQKRPIRALAHTITPRQNVANQTNSQFLSIKQPMLVMNIGGQITAIPVSLTPDQQLNIQQLHHDRLLQQEAQQQMILQQMQFAQHYQQQHQNQKSQRSITGTSPVMQKSGFPVLSMNHGMPIGTTSQPITITHHLISPLTQNIVQGQTPKILQPGSFIQTSTGLVQLDPSTSIARQSASSQDQFFYEQINPSSTQLPQSVLQLSQNPIVELPGAVPSTQNSPSSPLGVLHPPQNPLHIMGQQMQSSLFLTPNMLPLNTFGRSTPAVQGQTQTIPLTLQQQQWQYQPISQFQIQQNQSFSHQQPQQSMIAVPPDNSTSTALEIVHINESQNDTVVLPLLVQVNSPMQDNHHESDFHDKLSALTSNLISPEIVPTSLNSGVDSSVDAQKVANIVQKNISNSTSSHTSPITAIQQTQPTQIVLDSNVEPPQLSATSASLKEMPATASVSTSLQTHNENVVSTTQNESLPQAIVKPNILTHVINGFIIQESDKPFPVRKPFHDWFSETHCKEEDEKVINNKRKREGSFEDDKVPSTNKKSLSDSEKCDFNGNQMKSNEKPSSSKCNLEKALSPEPMKLSPLSMMPSISNCKTSEGSKTFLKYENVPEEPQTNDPVVASSSVMQWGISEVCDFVKNIPGCAIYAYDFATQEIDGEALLLIKPEHLITAMEMKLGPALKIVSFIDTLRPNKIP